MGGSGGAGGLPSVSGGIGGNGGAGGGALVNSTAGSTATGGNGGNAICNGAAGASGAATAIGGGTALQGSAGSTNGTNCSSTAATRSASGSSGTSGTSGGTGSLGATGLAGNGAAAILSLAGSTSLSVTNQTAGTIQGGDGASGGAGIKSAATTLQINNATGGLITGGAGAVGTGGAGVEITAGSAIITNTGMITGGVSASGISYGIFANGGTVTSLTNAQSNLTYSGKLPTNYSIIINSVSSFGKLSVSSGTGSTSFGVDSASIVSKNKIYAGVLNGVTSDQISNTTGTFKGYDWVLSLQSENSSIWDVIFKISLASTQQSLANSSNALKGVFNLQSSVINNSLSYDCSLFDTHGLCLSTGGRYSNTNTPTADNTGALVIGGYRINDNVRAGLYLDQGISSSMPSGINLKHRKPLFGAFAVWQFRQDGLGSQIKVAAGYNDADMAITRQDLGTSEAGSGSTNLTSRAVSAVTSYGIEIQPSWIALPYIGIRYTDVKAGGYKEASSSAVTAPLSYSTLRQSTTSLLTGIRWFGKLSDRVNLIGSVGVEQDVSNNKSSLTATGLDGLTSIVFNTKINKTRAEARVGTSVSIDKRQQLDFTVIYREEAFRHSSSTSAYGTYTIGF